MKLKSDRNLVAMIWIVLGVVARLIPHPPNVGPMTSISAFGGAQLSRGVAFLLTFTALVISDLLLALAQGHEAFGLWTFFTYTGFAAIIFAGSLLKGRLTFLRTAAVIAGCSLGFWLWTNFGIWLTGDHGLYPLTMEGLGACYLAALPFLQNSLLGDLAWGSVFFLSFAGIRQLAPRFGCEVQGA